MKSADQSLPPAHPPIARTSMTPRPWAGHPLARLGRWVIGRPTPFYPSPAAQPWLWRRVALLFLVVTGALVGAGYMAEVLPATGPVWAQHALLALFGVLFAWISAGFWTGVMGAWVLLRNGDPHAVTNALRPLEPGEEAIEPGVRTAIVMPICNEHVPTVFGGLRATFESLRDTGLLSRFDFFVLSDSNNPDLRAAEQVAFSELRESLGLTQSSGGIFYRWRQHRTKRKAGNVADFCRRWGRDYRYMVVLDADSVMTGECLTNLVRLMEAHPDAGIIQTAPRATGHTTLHARAQQFGSRVYGPLFTAGMHFWQLGESHYWGHNAILRIAPFIEHCALAPLPGKGSMSGEIMSHDFVEAALMRRAGWKVWIAYDLEGSFEQVPPNLIGEVGRDQRWCHGNLQNSRLMFEPGLHPVHRAVFLTGVLAYASAPLWLGFLLLSTLLSSGQGEQVPQYFTMPYQLFPIWPTSNTGVMLSLFGATAALLLTPKLLSLAVIVLRGRAQDYGGVIRLLASAVLEFFYTVLLAPVRMLFHTQFVIAALMGWKSGWKSPQRDGDATPWSEAVRRHGVHTLLALLWVGAILATSASFPWWLSPVLAGLLLAIPLSTLGSRVGAGEGLRRLGLLLIPEERDEPVVLQQAGRYAQETHTEARFTSAVLEPALRQRALAAFVPRATPAGTKAVAQAELVAHAWRAGPAGLSAAQRMRLLGSAPAMTGLSMKLGNDPAAAYASWGPQARAAAWRQQAAPPRRAPKVAQQRSLSRAGA